MIRTRIIVIWSYCYMFWPLNKYFISQIFVYWSSNCYILGIYTTSSNFRQFINCLQISVLLVLRCVSTLQCDFRWYVPTCNDYFISLIILCYLIINTIFKMPYNFPIVHCELINFRVFMCFFRQIETSGWRRRWCWWGSCWVATRSSASSPRI